MAAPEIARGTWPENKKRNHPVCWCLCPLSHPCKCNTGQWRIQTHYCAIWAWSGCLVRMKDVRYISYALDDTWGWCSGMNLRSCDKREGRGFFFLSFHLPSCIQSNCLSISVKWWSSKPSKQALSDGCVSEQKDVTFLWTWFFSHEMACGVNLNDLVYIKLYERVNLYVRLYFIHICLMQ